MGEFMLWSFQAFACFLKLSQNTSCTTISSLPLSTCKKVSFIFCTLVQYVPKLLTQPLAQPKMVMNNFGNRNFMQPMGRFNMHSWWPWFFLSRGVWGSYFLLFFLVQSMPLPLAQAKNGDQQFWKSKITMKNCVCWNHTTLQLKF
jgi:hypothetical protein